MINFLINKFKAFFWVIFNPASKGISMNIKFLTTKFHRFVNYSIRALNSFSLNASIRHYFLCFFSMWMSFSHLTFRYVLSVFFAKNFSSISYRNLLFDFFRMFSRTLEIFFLVFPRINSLFF